MIHGGNMNDSFISFCIGAVLTIVVVAVHLNFNQNSAKNVMNSIIEQCEKSLPRDQHCTLIAVPVSKD